MLSLSQKSRTRMWFPHMGSTLHRSRGQSSAHQLSGSAGTFPSRNQTRRGGGRTRFRRGHRDAFMNREPCWSITSGLMAMRWKSPRQLNLGRQLPIVTREIALCVDLVVDLALHRSCGAWYGRTITLPQVCFQRRWISTSRIKTRRSRFLMLSPSASAMALIPNNIIQ